MKEDSNSIVWSGVRDSAFLTTEVILNSKRLIVLMYLLHIHSEPSFHLASNPYTCNAAS